MTKIEAQRNTTYDVITRLVVWECPSCGIVYGIPQSFADDCRASGRRYWCPNGHNLGWKETEADKLRKKLTAEQERVEFLRDEERRQREHRQAAERRVAAMKGVVTRTKKRIARGKCVRCSCEFPDLAAHMATEHSDYGPAEEDTR